MDIIKELSRVISEVGFPAVVCIYLLTRIENTIKNLDRSIIDLTKNIDTLISIKNKA